MAFCAFNEISILSIAKRPHRKLKETKNQLNR